MLKSLYLSLVLLAGAAPALAAPVDDAIALLDAGKYEEAAHQLQPLAESGDAIAQHRLAILYFYGHGVPEDENRALELARLSAEAGNVDAMYLVGNIYVFGHTVPNEADDPDLEAAKWFHEAASRDHAEAEYNLGLLFLAGKGVIRSQEEAMKWIRRAAEHGHDGARNFLGGEDGHAK